MTNLMPITALENAIWEAVCEAGEWQGRGPMYGFDVIEKWAEEPDSWAQVLGFQTVLVKQNNEATESESGVGAVLQLVDLDREKPTKMWFVD